ncbi:MAG: hypothetical protein A2516_02445 [Alphaproteobacteria bacterium RIFOXYD12_FULL_60_8]|nr:MAG: hypothetical protein A2516_02445 [Alphaproteobacteria bacterium RIFOXYD12_FULL_60_8]
MTPQAQFQLNRAKNWGEFTKALRVFHGPEQNIFYADVSGNIGYYAPARVPIRAKGDGSRPSPGWSGDYDWKGWIPFEKLPHAFNPPTGLLFNANNQLVPEGYPYLLTSHWPASYRARRILEMLTAHSRHVDQGLSAMQMDTLSLVAQDLKPYLLNLEVLSERGKAAAQLIAAWDNTIDKDRPEPLIFNAWLRELKATIFEDELGDVFPKWSGMQTRAIAYALRDGPEWCDDIATPRVDPCAGRIGLALERALVWIESRHGTNMRTWKWGAEHQADFAHTLFRYFPMLDQLTGRTFPTNGDDDTVNRGSAQGSGDGTPFRHLHGAGLRAVYDLANIEESGFMIATGQSGNPLSPFYDNLLPLWREGHSLKFGAAAHYRLVLQPEE